MKTLKISTFLETANAMLAAPAPSRAERLALSTLIESTLMSAKAYGGFCYLPADQLAPGIMPGVITKTDATGYSSHVYPDDSRRRYFARGA
jgi:hypothetical protein